MSENPLDALKPGDRVAVDRRYEPFISVVERRTATQIIVAGMRFRATDGFEIGHRGFDHPRLAISAASMAFVERKELTGILYNLKVKLTPAAITSARATLDRAEAFLRSVGEWENENV